MSVRRVAWVVVAAALALAACSSDTTAKGTDDRDNVINAANAVCRQDVSDDNANGDAFKAQWATKDPTADQARDFLVNTVAPRYDAVAARMHDIAKPLKDGEKWDAALAALDARLRDFKYQIDQDPVALAKSVGKLDSKAGTSVGALFVDFGAKDCASL